jgi:exodeoxyribonuclease VII large subunit
MNSQRQFVFTVRQLTHYVRALLSQDRTLQDVWVRGEIRDLTSHASGHMYFTLTDEVSQLRCVMFREEAQGLVFTPSVGMEVTARGTITVYEPRGQYQLVVRRLEPAGIGDLYLAFDRLRRKLAAEGLFDTARKRPIPAFPHRIALLTSADGAALHDLLTTLRARWPAAHVMLIPTPVTGPAAVPGIVRSLQRLRDAEGADVAILARGGGSMDELSAFNAEEVARAIAAAPTPVVTGIGHETDVTIADLVADLRAATPTAAAAAVAPDRRELLDTVRAWRRSSSQRLRRLVAGCRREVLLLTARPSLQRPQLLLAVPRQQIDDLTAQIRQGVARLLAEVHGRWARAAERLSALSPKAVLSRGYAIARLPRGEVVRSIRQLTVGGPAELILHEGAAEVSVRKLREPAD